ncbi:MAG TPA: hypothetical protein PLP17_00490 [Oligoflexia bacterium]|nr:hypothetical protein [Oligoflexia bacterium]
MSVKGAWGLGAYARLFCAAIIALCLAQPKVAGAQNKETFSAQPPKPLTSLLNPFSKKFSVTGIGGIAPNVRNPFVVSDLTEGPNTSPPNQADSSKNAVKPTSPPGATPVQDASARAGLSFRSDNPDETPVLPPQETPEVRVEPDAPGPIKGMIRALRDGDRELAADYADSFVRMQQNYFFELRDIVNQIGQALIRQNVIDEDGWAAAAQSMEYELAKTRLELGEVIKPTHEVAMKRIAPDPQNQIHVFYFFSLNCSWCRYMAPDVERLWRSVSEDPKIKMTALSVGPVPDDWLKEYRAYTGLTLPVANGAELAQTFGVVFLPAVVIVSPNNNHAYLKTGQQSFERLYEFAKTVQGLPAVVTPQFKELAGTPISQPEILKAQQGLDRIKLAQNPLSPSSAKITPKLVKVSIERF